MGDIIFGNKEEFRDRSRKVVINLSFESKKDKQGECKPEEKPHDYTDYEEVKDAVVQQLGTEKNHDAPTAEADRDRHRKPDTSTPEAKLIMLLNRNWFNVLTTDKTLYNGSWRSKYIKALMREYGTKIAIGWAGTGTRNRQNLIKAHVIGALKYAGVIRGKNIDIARMALSIGVAPMENEVKATAAYMGHPQGEDESKQNPYRDWTDKYVKNR